MKTHDEVRFALRSADRHLQGLVKIFQVEITEMLHNEIRAGRNWEAALVGVRQVKIPEAESEIRSFLWELVHAFDLSLIFVNENLSLGIALDLVSWKTVDEAATKQGKNSAELQALRALKAGSSFQQIKEYRNFAHRGQLMLMLEVTENGVQGSKLAPEHKGAQSVMDVPVLLSGYLADLRTVMNSIGFWL